MSRTRVSSGRSNSEIDVAALIWAEATAWRDGDPEVATLGEARPVITAALDASSSSVLLSATDSDGHTEGFALLTPAPGDEDRAELRYLGVRPSAWGRSVAGALLQAIEDGLAGWGYAGAELWVYLDNTRARALYERHGWARSGLSRTHNRSDRVECRYVLSDPE